MLISFNWLTDYVKLPPSVTPEAVAEKLKLATVEVEKVTRQGENLENIVVGKILSAEKHPNADKLKLCQVDVGKEKLAIVCGGSNVAEGMLVAVAKVGARVVWHGEGDPVELQPVKIRGIESRGMICASDEIGLLDVFPKKDEKEIVELSSFNFKPGTPLAEALALDDTILEIDNKSLSNRPDLWGHFGLAREVAALFKGTLKKITAPKIKGGADMLTVKIQDQLACPRYMAVALNGVQIAPSPSWLQNRLRAVGLRPINNIVDVTNYILLDLGQPMHAFDRLKVKSLAYPAYRTDRRQAGKKSKAPTIVVRTAREGEEFITLDEQKRKLDSSMLLITNGEKNLAIAGVMGGLESGISPETTEIVLESANFNAASIRRTSTKLGLRTDSSARFEKSLDPNLCSLALAQAVALVQKLCPTARVVSRIVDEKKFHLFTGPLHIPREFFAKKLGTVIPAKSIVSSLGRLGFGVRESKTNFSVTIPSWRASKDVARAEDVVEEVARLYGYDNIPSVLPSFPINPPTEAKEHELERTLRDILVRELAYTESYNYSFVSLAEIKNIGDELGNYLELNNPISEERPYLRRNLLPNLLENIKSNNPERGELKLFEIGKVFRKNEQGESAAIKGNEFLPGQDSMLTLVVSSKDKTAPFWEARRAAERIFARLAIQWATKAADKVEPWEHPSRLTLIAAEGRVVGTLHEIHPRVSEAFGIEGRIGVFTLNLSALAEKELHHRATFKPISSFPEVKRDIAFIVDEKTSHADISDALQKIDPLLDRFELFDVFAGSAVPAGKKSMGYQFIFSSPERTLTNEEVARAEEKVIEMLAEKFGAAIRR